MYTILVDKGLPLPEKLKTIRSTYPFSSMEVGDSFLVKTKTARDSARSSAYQFCRRHRLTWRFAVLWTQEEQGWRVWRVA